MMRIYFTILLTILTAAPLPAQRGYDEQVQVTIIEVPVTVADRNGNAVRGLTKDNFQLFDDGKRVDIEYFDVIDLRAADQNASLPAAARRNFLLLFDLANSSPGLIRRGQNAARQFVEKGMSDRDLAAVAISTAERGLAVLTSFTSDRLFLTAVIDTLDHEAGFKVADPLMLTAPEGPLRAPTPIRQEAAAAAQEEIRSVNALNDQARANEMRNRLRNQMRNLGSVAQLLDRLRGQKQIILLTEGFDATLITGREELGFQATQQENDAVLSGEIWKVDSEKRFGSVSGTSEVTEMAEIFRRSDVRLHAIDIRGIRTDVDAREGVRKSSTESLSLLATPTGGVVFKNTNDLGENFDRVLQSQEVIYILGFRAPAAKSRKFHPLRVKLVDVPGASATHRMGYFDPTPASHDLERTLGAAEIMMNRIPAGDLAVHAIAAPFLRQDGFADVPVIVEIGGKELIAAASGTSVSVEFFVYAFDRNDLIRDHVYERATIDLEKLRDRLTAGGVKFYQTLRLQPGHYSIRVLARSGAKNGFQSMDLAVPGSGSPYVAPPLVFDTDLASRVMIRGASRDGVSAEYPFQVGESVFVPSAAPLLRSGQTYDVALFAFHAAENVEAEAQFESDAGAQPAKTTLVGRAAGSAGMEKLLLSVATPKLESGRYALVMKVRNKSGGGEQRVSLPVVVR